MHTQGKLTVIDEGYGDVTSISLDPDLSPGIYVTIPFVVAKVYRQNKAYTCPNDANRQTMVDNAERLALVWNMHDELVESIKAIANMSHLAWNDPVTIKPIFEKIEQVAKEAIKAAKGEQ